MRVHIRANNLISTCFKGTRASQGMYTLTWIMNRIHTQPVLSRQLQRHISQQRKVRCSQSGYGVPAGRSLEAEGARSGVRRAPADHIHTSMGEVEAREQLLLHDSQLLGLDVAIVVVAGDHILECGIVGAVSIVEEAIHPPERSLAGVQPGVVQQRDEPGHT